MAFAATSPVLTPKGIKAFAQGRRAAILKAPTSHAVQHQLLATAPENQQVQQQPHHAHTHFVNSLDRQASVSGPGAKHTLILSSTTSVAAAADATLPTAFARVLVGAALALSTVYALMSSPASSATGIAFAPGTRSPSTPSDVDSTASATATATTAPAFSSLPVLRTPEQFDAFVLASNRAGYLAIVLFHAPWCSASNRMEKELQGLSQMFTGRRVVFARVDCSIKQGIRPGQPLGQSQSLGFRLQRCDLTQLHRIHKTPTVRMYYHNACVDEVIGCRPIDFRQATSDMTFKYSL